MHGLVNNVQPAAQPRYVLALLPHVLVLLSCFFFLACCAVTKTTTVFYIDEVFSCYVQDDVFVLQKLRGQMRPRPPQEVLRSEWGPFRLVFRADQLRSDRLGRILYQV